MNALEVSHYYNTGSVNAQNSLTLATRLGDMLCKAEEKYGQRDQSWTVLGVEFGSNGPYIWFPQGKGIVIQLGLTALNDTLNASYQLAHECIHLLSPCGSSVVPVIEEGLATVFSAIYIAEEFDVIYNTDDAPYAEAATLVRELLSTYPDAISRLRAVEPAFTKITTQTFVQAGLEVSSSLMGKLLASFKRN
ncbi:hypothetical protein [Pseudomonas coronafaciens]|uniref:Uncharacterized protein n=1 Tax=Pseudomonas coronafaciens pv. coronafaciens TaxID=235275 RepID=A0AAE6QJ96_9PSED|nr:hypothetical protein [Pseudomonas coronafaciens]QGT83537.1 hypothetical protein GMO17_21390 [Pseudomonas coronafaciens pv. coronafaciens]